MRHGRPGPQQRLSDAALALPAVAQSRAAELLIAAAAHRISVEHWLAKQQIEQQQTAPPPSPPPSSPPPTVLKAAHGAEVEEAMADMKLTFSPEMIEAWMTAEDAVEVASWHMKADQGETCSLASSAFEEGFAAAFSGLTEPPRASSEMLEAADGYQLALKR